MADAFCKECGIDVVFDSTKTDGFGTPEQYCTACESRLNAEWVEQRNLPRKRLASTTKNKMRIIIVSLNQRIG